MLKQAKRIQVNQKNRRKAENGNILISCENKRRNFLKQDKNNYKSCEIYFFIHLIYWLLDRFNRQKLINTNWYTKISFKKFLLIKLKNKFPLNEAK